MAINRIGGQMLDDNLLRDGNDLAIETNLLYVDVANGRIGIKNGAPTVELDLAGDAKVSGSLTVITSAQIANVNTSGSTILSTSGNLVLTSSTGNISVNSKKIVNLADGVDPNDAVNKGQLDTVVGSISSDRIVSDNSQLVVIDDGISPGSFEFELDTVTIGTINNSLVHFTPSITSDATVTGLQAQFGNVGISGATIGSDTGTLQIVTNLAISGMGTGRVLYMNGSGLVDTQPNFAFVGSSSTLTLNGVLNVDQLQLDNDKILATTAGMTLETTANGDLTINTGTGVIDMTGTSALQLPAGITAERPGTPAAGMTRWNTTDGRLEYYDGTTWQGVQLAFSVTSQQIIPDGISISYALNKVATTDSVLVAINGILQDPEGGAVYSVTGSTITFSSVLTASDIVSIRFLEA